MNNLRSVIDSAATKAELALALQLANLAASMAASGALEDTDEDEREFSEWAMETLARFRNLK